MTDAFRSVGRSRDREPGGSTLPEEIPVPALRRARRQRRVGVIVLVVFLVVGAAGLLGSHTSVAVAEGNGYRLTVTYPGITRPGLPVRWEIQVEHRGGFSGPIKIAISFDYIHLFDVSNTEPDASSATATADSLLYVFDPPSGSSFRVAMDGNAEPGEHGPYTATTSVLVDGAPIVSVTYRTVMVP